MTSTHHARIIASMRDQILDVRIGILTAEQWISRYDAAVESGVRFPDEIVSVYNHFKDNQ